MPIGDFVSTFPPIVFLVIHAALFLIGVYFAQRALSAGSQGLAAGFALFALAEISYMTYHLDWTTFLFAHTISEVLDGLAFIVIFLTAVQRVMRPVEAAR